ncbi:helix-turn-helix domain-containing protein [Sphingosinicella sp. BN140058]|uniref:winged helix-turn-helix transcriptional regulator n=1 Tax=Sphingosinicella sp. BN140058 TaxID=1892855 RepID=UPI0019801BDA|nr:helix-turn-helix domain-containing protein [Sphingosinicella sp. BN140058]
MTKHFRKDYGCPVELAVDLLGGKWKTVILARIKEGPLTYGGLRNSMRGLSDKVLTEKLKDLVELCVVEHVAIDAAGDRKHYRLTDRGRDLAPVLEALYRAGGLLADQLDIRFPQTADRHVR